MNPPSPAIKRTLKRIAPLSAGKVLTLLYGAMGLLFMPLFLLLSVITSRLPHSQGGLPLVFGIGFALAAPVIYAVMGFLIGVIGAAIYNLVAKLVGGIEVEVE
jgi:hypothetical protein